MNLKSTELVLGIDGGGTKTAAWLASLHGQTTDRPLGEGTTGPGNPRSAGFETALANIEDAIEQAFASAGIRRTKVAGICLALAGADRESEQERLRDWCQTRDFAEHVELTNDAAPLLAVAAEQAWGVALISGTGSIAYGRDRAGHTARCGGWGYLFGDEGSAYQLALAGLRAAACSADGRSPATSLLASFQQRLQVSSPSGLIESIYRPDTSRQQIADLAEVVFIAAAEGDQIARRLVDHAAAELASLVVTLARRLGFVSGQFPLAVAGGLLLRQPLLQERLRESLIEQDTAPEKIVPVPDPVQGAVALARRVVIR